jgi:hypothetical protein
MSNPRERAAQLVKLAYDRLKAEGLTSPEGRTAALQAVKIIEEHKLLGEAPPIAGVGPDTGFMGIFNAIMTGFVASGLAKEVNVAVMASSANEIIVLKARCESQERQIDRLNAQLREAVTPARPRRRVRAR